MLPIVDARQAIEPGMWFHHFSGPEGCLFSNLHRPTSQKVPSVHFSKQNLSVQSPSVWPVSFSLFTRFIQVALEPLQQEGMLILPYLDDWLLCARSYQRAVNNTQRLLFHVATLGLRVNFQKRCLTPSHSVCFL